MKVTAATITDEQIRELFDSTPSYERSMSFVLMVSTALGAPAGPCFSAPSVLEIRDTRARCADYLNKRGAK